MDADDLKEITQLKCKKDTNLLSKGSDGWMDPKLAWTSFWNAGSQLFLKCGMENRNQQPFIALRLLYILCVIVYFTVEECAFLSTYTSTVYGWEGGTSQTSQYNA